jgi:hypothetical protein
MKHPSARLPGRPSTVAALLVTVAAGCAPRVALDDTPSRAATAAAARSRGDIALVTIDADATIPLDPGESVGLFVQYARGGHWIVSTTCDTRTSGASCAFDVVISPAPGAAFSNLSGQGLTREDTLELQDDGTVHLVTATSLEIDGLTFDSDPGALIQIDALLDGADEPRLVHLVSDGAVVEGVPTNPVEISPSSP